MIDLFAAIYVVFGLAYLAGTIVLATRKRPVRASGSEPKMFVFVVPALNERTVIVPTVESLLAACGGRGRVLVVDDGSTDGTGDVVEALNNPDVKVLRRTPPHARQGKGRALNEGYRFIRSVAARSGFDPSDVVLCIVDADGRVRPDVLSHVAPYFTDPKVGAVQLLVRIRNRTSWLARFQDYEFLVFSSLTQTAREHIGSVGLGGNGQFTRLEALMALGENPWSDCLTEDLDLGVRLAAAGWQNRFCGETWVDQQGLTSISSLIRQRTRWAQGHFQCWRLIPQLVRSDLPTLTVLDLTYYLGAPILVLFASGVFTGTLGFTAYQTIVHPEYWMTPFGALVGGLMGMFTFGPAVGLSFAYRRKSKELTVAQAVVLAHLLFVYNYIWYIAEWKAVGRMLRRRNGWAKTQRVVEPTRPTASTAA